MSDQLDSDRNYDPMIFDVMRETANRVVAMYVAWEDEAADPREAAHWQAERFRTRHEVRAVDPDSLRAVQAKFAQLREELAAMPEHAPAIPWSRGQRQGSRGMFGRGCGKGVRFAHTAQPGN